MFNKVPSILIISFISFILISIWFKNGNIMGTGESGLPFYDFQIQFKLVETAWFKYALGGPTNVNLASAPSYFILGELQKLGVPNVLMQAIFIWICLVVSGISIFKLTKEFFPELKQKYLLLAVFFYWFNPISLVNVWNRFLNNYFIFFALLPLSLYFFIKGIKTKKYHYTFLFVISSAFFSYAHSSMAFNILLWFVIFYSAIFYVLILRSFKERFFILKYLSIFFGLWFLTNLWWISQVFNYIYSRSFDEVTSSFFTNTGNYSSFSDLSSKLGRLSEVLKFTHHSFYSTTQLPWFKIYDFFIIEASNYLITFLILLSVFLGRKRLSVLFFGLLFIVALFLIKGNSYPFGEILSFLFLRFSSLQLFRNPFEKFGFLLILCLTPLFAYSISLAEKFKWRFNIIYLFILIYVVIIWGFPYWTGLVFTANFSPVNNPKVKYEVVVPDDYKKASEWLKLQNEDFRLVTFPLFGEGITYDWQKGFSGIELSNQLLPKTSVSFDTTIPFYHDIAEKIEDVFVESDEFYPLMNVLNAKYILLRQDINWKERSMRDPQVILNVLNKKEEKGEFKRVATFGRLSFWENLYYKPTEIAVANTRKVISKQPKVDDLVTIEGNEVLISENTSKNINTVPAAYISEIHPEKRIVIREFDDNKFVPQYVFPHISMFPDSKYYLLISVKEGIQDLLIVDPREKLEFKLMMLGKRLREALYEGQKKNDDLLFTSLDKYRNLLVEYRDVYNNYQMALPDYIREDLQVEQAEIFYKHLLYFKDIESHYSNGQTLSSKNKRDTLARVTSYSEFLRNMVVELNIYPKYDLIVTEAFPLTTRLIYKFLVTKDGDYELLIKDRRLLENFDITTDKVMVVQLNDRMIILTPSWTKEGNLSLGKYSFRKGENEVSFNAPPTINLINVDGDISIKVDHREVIRSFPINNFIAGRKYKIDFDYLIKKGSSPTFLIYTDNSSMRMNKKIPSVVFNTGIDYYNFDRKHFTFITGTIHGATSAELTFKLESWNNCESINQTLKHRCEDKNFKAIYDKPSEVIISNILVTEEFNETLLFELTEQQELGVTNTELPLFSYNKISPTKYEIDIKGAKGTYYLTLSQLFDAGWNLKTENGEKTGKGPFRVNIFENGWQLDKQGDFRLILDYEPQKILEFTRILSLFILAITILTLIIGSLKIYFKNE